MNPNRKSNIVICGAGIAGVAAAYHLAVKHGIRDVTIVDERPPLSLTSDKSSECYRNWWPGPGNTMVSFMNRSIDLLEELAEESDNYFQMNRRGYVFLTADPQRADRFQETARAITDLGAGELRIHDGRQTGSNYPRRIAHGVDRRLDGADLVLDPAMIHDIFPFLSTDTVAMLHSRRCGWLSAQQLGMYLLQQAKDRGVSLVSGRVTGVTTQKGHVRAVHLQGAGGPSRVQTNTFVIAAGPLLKRVGSMLDVELPVFNELHGKIIVEDYLNIIPRDAPMIIWSDPVTLPWSLEEREELAADEKTRWLTRQFPEGVHFRPEGGTGAQTLLMLWTYHLEEREPVWPLPPFEPEYPEVVMRGLSRMIPGLSVYYNRMSKPEVDGGYYCKTRENRPLIGPLPVDGAYVIGALSGYGIMAAMAAGELLASHVTGGRLPSYAPDFLLSRYDDPNYQELLKGWDASTGQL